LIDHGLIALTSIVPGWLDFDEGWLLLLLQCPTLDDAVDDCGPIEQGALE